jgi:hypothetical protein
MSPFELSTGLPLVHQSMYKKCDTRNKCHPETYSPKDLAQYAQARSLASTLGMTTDEC